MPVLGLSAAIQVVLIPTTGRPVDFADSLEPANKPRAGSFNCCCHVDLLGLLRPHLRRHYWEKGSCEVTPVTPICYECCQSTARAVASFPAARAHCRLPVHRPGFLHRQRRVQHCGGTLVGAHRRCSPDDVLDYFLTVITNGKITTDKVLAHRDPLTEFPYLGTPHRTATARDTF